MVSSKDPNFSMISPSPIFLLPKNILLLMYTEYNEEKKFGFIRSETKKSLDIEKSNRSYILHVCYMPNKLIEYNICIKKLKSILMTMYI